MADSDKVIVLSSSDYSMLMEIPEIKKLSQELAGSELFLESRRTDGTVVRALDLGTLLKLLPTLLPVILALFTGGGFSIPAITALIQALLSIFGASSTPAASVWQAPQAVIAP